MDGSSRHQDATEQCCTEPRAYPHDNSPERTCIHCGRVFSARRVRGRPPLTCGAAACRLALYREQKLAARRRRRFVVEGAPVPFDSCPRCFYTIEHCRCVGTKRHLGDGA